MRQRLWDPRVFVGGVGGPGVRRRESAQCHGAVGRSVRQDLGGEVILLTAFRTVKRVSSGASWLLSGKDDDSLSTRTLKLFYCIHQQVQTFYPTLNSLLATHFRLLSRGQSLRHFAIWFCLGGHYCAKKKISNFCNVSFTQDYKH